MTAMTDLNEAYKQGEKEIFKLQLPLHTNAANPKILVYNKDRTHLYEMGITEDLLDLFAPEEGIYKIYCECSLHNEQLLIGPEVEEQNW
jgi:hypothetical protein